MANGTTPGEDPRDPQQRTRQADIQPTVQAGGEGEGQVAATEAQAAAERARNQGQAAAAQIQAVRTAAEEAEREEAQARAFNAARQESIRVALQDAASAARQQIERDRQSLDRTDPEAVERFNTSIDAFKTKFGEGGTEVEKARVQARDAAEQTNRRIAGAFEPVEKRAERANRTIAAANRLAAEANAKGGEENRRQAATEFAQSGQLARALADVQVREAETLLKSEEIRVSDEQRKRIERLKTLGRRIEKASRSDIDDLTNPDSPTFKAAQKAYERYTQDAAALEAYTLGKANELEKKRVQQLINEPDSDAQTVERLKRRNEDAEQLAKSTQDKWTVLSRGLSSGTFGVPAPATEAQARAEGEIALRSADRVVSAPGKLVKQAEVPFVVPSGFGAEGLGGTNVVRVRPLDWSDAKEGIANWIEANADSPGAATVFRMTAPDNPVDVYLFVNAAGQVAQLSYKGSKLLIKGYGESALKAEDAARAAASAIRNGAGGAPAVAKQLALAPAGFFTATGGVGAPLARTTVRIAEPLKLRTIIDPREGRVVIRGSETATPLRESARAVQLEGSRLSSRMPPSKSRDLAERLAKIKFPDKTDKEIKAISNVTSFDDRFISAQVMSRAEQRRILSEVLGQRIADEAAARQAAPHVVDLLSRRDAALTSSQTNARVREVLLGQRLASSKAEQDAVEQVLGFKASPAQARDALRLAADAEVTRIDRGGRSVYREPAQAELQRQRQQLSLLKADLQRAIAARAREGDKPSKALNRRLKVTSERIEALDIKIEPAKVSAAKIASVEKPIGKETLVQSEKPGDEEKPGGKEKPIDKEKPADEEKPGGKEKPIDKEKPAEPPPVTPPPGEPPGGEPPPPERTSARTQVLRFKKGDVVSYEPPRGKNVPTRLVLRRGINEQRVYVLTGRDEFGRDLSAAVPNNPRISPAASLRVEAWGKTQRRRIRITDPDEPVVGVIDTKKRTIRFRSKKGFESVRKRPRPAVSKKRFRKS